MRSLKVAVAALLYISIESPLTQLVQVPTRRPFLLELLAAVSRYVEAGPQGAANTRRGYAPDLRSFEKYCRHQYAV